MAIGGTQQSNRDDQSKRHRRTEGVVAGRREVDMPASKRRCRNERLREEEEVTDAIAMTEEDAAGVWTMAAGWKDEDNGTK